MEMTGPGVYKLDNGESYPSNCFPIRSFYHQSKEGAGHWLVAHRNALEERIFEKKRVTGSHIKVYSGKREQGRPECASTVLDAQLLVKLHCVEKPSDLCCVNVSDQGLQTVRLEGLEEFNNIAYINASENHLTLEPFSRFPALRELELALNGLHTLKICAEDFQRLKVLDLSFNSITGESILNLGLLPHLKILHLTGNQLQMLPPNMAGPCTCHKETTHQCDFLFQTLEVLMLDDNRLTSLGLFESLANLKRLQHLNLQGNIISGVPFLEQMAPLQDAQTSFIPNSPKQGSGRTVSFLDVTMIDASATLNQQKSTTGTSKRKDPRCPEDFGLPFPELCHLNLANNKIAEEEALLPVALFPKLKELVIHSNPLTTQRCGDPPMLTSFLQDRLGINIKRKKSSDRVKEHIRPAINPKRKVKTAFPRIPNIAFITANQHTSEELCGGKVNGDSLLSQQSGSNPVFDSLSQTRVEEEQDIIKDHEYFGMTSAGLSYETHQNAEPFFVTEVDGLHEADYQEQEDKKKMLTKDRHALPKKLIGYEILLDETCAPEIPEISGIQHAVRALEHTLENLLVFRDAKANLDRPQKPYTEREKKIKNLAPLGPKRSKGEKVEEILIQIKEMKTISKVPLGNVLSRGNDACEKEYKEALTLLKDMQRRYKMTHQKTFAQAAQLDT
ncbi:X-ray radiation resistance-associated protein 1 isoform X2 [Triplophysa dalaica]|uniref:X-ray radiation resistance-associated protein 1 isoform X2 n=1 Tax=Triplophysa dalaica TaxID=1582913 RepID=UPI0024DFE67C|nr:X-ray radiation resistance-associated protein 1 isoform X2 [Triplophysa dalaica]